MLIICVYMNSKKHANITYKHTYLQRGTKTAFTHSDRFYGVGIEPIFATARNFIFSVSYGLEVKNACFVLIVLFVFVNLSVCYIVQLIQCLARHCIYCLLLVACASVPVAAWLPDFVRSVATPCGVFCAPYPLVARQFSPRVQQSRNSYSRPVRRSQKQG